MGPRAQGYALNSGPYPLDQLVALALLVSSYQTAADLNYIRLPSLHCFEYYMEW